MKRVVVVMSLILGAMVLTPAPTLAVSQEKVLNLPEAKGRLEARVWRESPGTVSGNTLQWDYKVAAYYAGSRKVDWIEVSWYASASLRNGASIQLGIGKGQASVGASTSWQAVRTPNLSWRNSQGQKIADYQMTMIAGPRIDYRKDSIFVTSTARLKLIGDPKTYRASAGV